MSTYTGATAWSAEGARVGLVTCKKCGAAILIDPRDDEMKSLDLHDAWHDRYPSVTDKEET